jgi:potassium efflux system protein
MGNEITKRLKLFNIGIFFAGMISAYIMYIIMSKVLKQPDLISSLHLVWSYPVFVKDNNSISIGKLIIGIGLIISGYYLSKFLSHQLAYRIFPRLRLEKGAVAALENLSFYGLFLFFSLFALNIANVPLTMFTVLGGAFAIGVGFGSQNLMNNFISGIILQIERPVRVGDTVEIDGSRGVIHQIKGRSTIINMSNGIAVVFPNSHFLEKKIQNFNLLNNNIRLEVDMILPKDTNLPELKQFLEKKILEYPNIIKKPNPELIFTSFLDTGNLAVTMWVWIDLDKIKDKKTMESNIRFLALNFVNEKLHLKDSTI